jgi:uncharacterized membrane protein
MNSSPIADTIRVLEQELEGLDQRRGELVRAIETLRPLAGGAVSRGPTRVTRRVVGGVKFIVKARAAKRNKQTNKQTKQEPRQGAVRSLPNGEEQASILSALKGHGGSMTPGDLAKSLRTAPVTVRKWIKPLLQSKAVIATGVTMSRRFSLPGRGPKEVP